jgi:hypothetical protein
MAPDEGRQSLLAAFDRASPADQAYVVKVVLSLTAVGDEAVAADDAAAREAQLERARPGLRLVPGAGLRRQGFRG